MLTYMVEVSRYVSLLLDTNTNESADVLSMYNRPYVVSSIDRVAESGVSVNWKDSLDAIHT